MTARPMPPGRVPFGIAHRAPRSARACTALAEAGATMFELDIQLRGEHIVVSHFLPLTGRLSTLPVERDNWRLRPGTRQPRDASLADALAALPPTAEVLLDPKHQPGFEPLALVEQVGRLLPAFGGPGRFVVSTGNPDVLDAYRRLGLRTWRSIGTAAALRAVLEGGQLPHEGVSIRHTLLDAEAICALRAVTGIIACWTVNGLPRAQHLLGLGADAITTDRAAVLTWVRDAAPAGG